MTSDESDLGGGRQQASDKNFVCGYAIGEDRDAKPDEEECGKQFDSIEEWMNHTDIEHRGQDQAECPRCGDLTKWSEEQLPTVEFFNGNEEVGVCLDCQHDLWEKLSGGSE